METGVEMEEIDCSQNARTPSDNRCLLFVDFYGDNFDGSWTRDTDDGLIVSYHSSASDFA
jgi:hypothetical protein